MMESLTPEEMPRSQKVIAVLWPSFIIAIGGQRNFFFRFQSA